MKSIQEHPVVLAAAGLARTWHRDQLRKYTLDPYIVHCSGVSEMVAMACPDPEVVAAAWLHDVLEDTDCTERRIEADCGARVLGLVQEVTDVSRPEDGNRGVRKAMDREHLMEASAEGQTIKLADITDNTFSIAVWDPDFARVYLSEVQLLIPVLRKGSVVLQGLAWKVLEMGQAHLMDCAVADRVGRWS